jgi:hypothetical protein
LGDEEQGGPRQLNTVEQRVGEFLAEHRAAASADRRVVISPTSRLSDILAERAPNTIRRKRTPSIGDEEVIARARGQRPTSIGDHHPRHLAAEIVDDGSPVDMRAPSRC